MDASVVNILRLISVVVAAVMLGKWFQKEVMKARVKGAWYKAYYSPPGLIIIASAIILPLVVWAIKN